MTNLHRVNHSRRFAMDHQRLRALLDRINASPGGPLPADLQALAGALGRGNTPQSPHYMLDELRTLVKSRRQKGWELPEHLLECPLCLEAFSLLLEGTPAVRGRTSERYHALGPTGSSARAKPTIPFPKPVRRWRRSAVVAAAVIFISAIFLHEFLRPPMPVRVEKGALVTRGHEVAMGEAKLKSGAPVLAREDSTLVLDDGSHITLDSGAEFDVSKGFGRSITLSLLRGRLVALVTKKHDGASFAVSTPLGQVIVVGTRFSVDCAREQVKVFQRAEGQTEAHPSDDRISKVTVNVYEGTVLVRASGQEASVATGQSAVLREGQTHIDVREEAS